MAKFAKKSKLTLVTAATIAGMLLTTAGSAFAAQTNTLPNGGGLLITTNGTSTFYSFNYIAANLSTVQTQFDNAIQQTGGLSNVILDYPGTNNTNYVANFVANFGSYINSLNNSSATPSSFDTYASTNPATVPNNTTVDDYVGGQTVTSTYSTAPAVSTVSAINSTTVAVTYSTAPTTTPTASAFTVVQNGTTIPVSNISMNGTVATLTLSSALSNGTFTVNGVSGSINLTAPALKSATYSGTTLTLNFSTPLNASSLPSYKDFAVDDNGTAISVNPYVQVSGSSVILTLASAPAAATDALLVSYTVGTNPIQSTSGASATSFVNQPFAEASVSAPTSVKAVVAANAVATVSWVAPTSGPTPSSYTLLASTNGGAFVPVVTGISSASTSQSYTGSNGQSVAFEVASVDSSNNLYTSTPTTAMTLSSVAPALTSAVTSADGTQLVLTYNKPVALATGKTAAQLAGSYDVLDKTTADSATTAAISGDQVTLTLTNPLGYGDAVTEQFTTGDLVGTYAGNAVLSDTSAVSVTNNVTTNSIAVTAGTTPTLASNVLSVPLTFTGVSVASSNLISLSVTNPAGVTTSITPGTSATLAFNVNNAAGTYTYNIIDKNGVKYTAALKWTAPTTEVAKATGTVSATLGTQFALGTVTVASGYLVDPSGNIAAIPAGSISGGGVEINPTATGTYTILAQDATGNWYTSTVSNPSDFTPSVQSATVSGTSLVLTYNIDLNTTTVPAVSAFTVDVNGSPVTVSSVGIATDQVTLILANPVLVGQTVTVGYTAPSSNPIQGVTGNAVDVAGLTSQAVTNNTVAASLASAAVVTGTGTSANTLVLTYSSALSAASATTPPVASSYSVSVNGANDTVTNVVINATNKTVTLTLAANVTTAQTVTVSYTAPATNPVTDANANAVTSFAPQIVAVS